MNIPVIDCCPYTVKFVMMLGHVRLSGNWGADSERPTLTAWPTKSLAVVIQPPFVEVSPLVFASSIVLKHNTSSFYDRATILKRLRSVTLGFSL